MPRLKSYNAGARLSLREDDLLIGFFAQDPSVAVHHLRVIVAANGNIESGEYFILGPHSKFVHTQHVTPAEWLTALLVRLERLACIENQVGLRHLDFDVLLYERFPRRSIRYWQHGCEVCSSLPSDDFFIDFGIEDRLCQPYIKAFEDVVEQISTRVSFTCQVDD